MRTSAFDLAILGTLSVDTFVTAGDQVFDQLLGGSAAYAAAGARIWSKSIGVIARVDSGFPEAHLEDLQNHGINTAAVKRLPETMRINAFFAYEDVSTRSSPNPARSFLRLGLPMPKSMIAYQPPPKSDPITGYPGWVPHPEDIPSALEGAKGAHLASCAYTSQYTSVDRLQALRVEKLSLDPATEIMKARRPDLIKSLVNGIDVFVVSEKQARALLGPGAGNVWQVAERLLELGSQHVVLKRGAKGLCLLNGQSDERWLIPAYPCPVVDVTGAGHAFGGGFLAGWVETGSLVEAALAGAISASLTIEGSGPFYPLGTMPGLAEARRESLRQKAHRL